VLYAVGAPNDRRLDIDGMGLPGTGTATELVAWINGHPEFTDLAVDLSHERVVVIGNGNVALDVARVLTADPDALGGTDIADHALAALRDSKVAEVVIVARRGPVHSAFTLPELIGLTSTCDVVLDPADRDLVLRDLAAADDPLTRSKLEILSKLGDGGPNGLAPVTRPRIRFAFGLTPSRIVGDERAEAVEFTVTGTDQRQTLPAGLVLTSIGYRGKPVRDLPFDEGGAVVPNDGGRVVDPASGLPVRGGYVAGWIKRGPTGFIGTNKSCASETVHNLVADYNAGRLVDPAHKPAGLEKLIRSRCPDVVDGAGWKAIDEAEVERGGDDRPRRKYTSVADMLAAAASAPQPPLHERLLAGLRR
jgi:ferredoxin--NADP+ reductase